MDPDMDTDTKSKTIISTYMITFDLRLILTVL